MNQTKNPSPRTSTPRTPTSRVPTPRTPTTPTKKGVFFSEKIDDIQEPSHEDIEEQARRLGVDIEKEPHLLQLVKESLLSQVPPPWKPCFDATKKAWYYYNQDTYKSQWEHPADPVYREKIKSQREELAMDLMQNIDTRTAKPLKSLPPLKKSGKTMLDPMPQLKELKKLGPIPKAMGSSMEPTLNMGLRSLGVNPTAYKSLGQPNDNKNLKTEDESLSDSDRKHLAAPRDVSVQKNANSNVITAVPKKAAGLKLTGAGSAFMKRDLLKSEAMDKQPLLNDVNYQVVPNPISSQENTLAGKPFKSILVNSISSNLRSQKQSTNKKWSVDLDSLKDDEQSVWNQIQQNETRSTVKFKLDEDTELHFDTSLNENVENVSEEESKETTEQESEEEDESDKEDSESETDVSQSHVSIKKDGSLSSKNSVASNQSIPKQMTSSSATSATTSQSKPNSEKIVSNQMLEQEQDPASITPIVKNEGKVDVNQSRSEQTQGKTLEETINELNREREEAVKRTQEELEKQKSEDIKKAKDEIENILKLEMDKIKADFQIKIQTKRAELLHQHNKELTESIEMLKRQQEQQVLQLEVSHAAAMKKMREDAEKEFELEKATIREDIRRSFGEEKEQLKRKLVQENEFELNKLKFELEQQKGVLELELQTSIESLQKDIQSKLESAKAEEIIKKEESRALETKDKELKELRLKYDRLESKYNILKKQIQSLVESGKPRSKSADTISKSQSDQLHKRRGVRGKAKSFIDDDLILSDNEDSANESDQNIRSSSASIDRQKSSDDEKFQDETQVENEMQSRDGRLNSALKSIEEIRQQILALTKENLRAKAQSIEMETRKKNSKSQKLNRVRSRQSQPDPLRNSSKDLERHEYSEQNDDSKESSAQLPNKNLVEEAKDFIRSQRHRLNQENQFMTPIATTLGVKQRLAIEMRKAQTSESQNPKSKNIPPFLNLDHRDISETESSGVGSWKDMQSIQKKKVSQEIDHICQSLSALDGQMKEIWTMVRSGSGKTQGSNFPSGSFNRSFAEDFADYKYRQNQPITAGVAQFSLTERQSLPGTIDQLKQMWTSTVRDTNNQGDTFGVNHGTGMAYDNQGSSFVNPGRASSFNLLPTTESGLLSTINPSVLQFKHLAFDNSLSNFIPVRGNTSLLVETLDEEIKQFREKQQQLVEEFSPQREMTTDANALHERTKHLREWLDKF